MSQQHSQEPEHNRKNMAVSYSSNLAPSRNQTLPSFRELLPPHLHEEIDSAAYYAQSRSMPQDRSPEAASFSKSRQHQQHPQQHPQQHQNRGQALPPPGTPTQGPVYPSRGPSPILPPLRDLQSAASGRHLDHPMGGYDAAPRPGPEPVYGGRASMEDDRFRPAAPYPAGPGGGGGAPPAMYNPSHSHGHNQPKGYGAHPYPPPSYASESEYSPMTHSHTLPASTFGVIGEPLDSRGKRRRGNLPKPVTDILRAWFHDHLDHPYPTEEDKQIFMSRTGLSISQISNWFINARRRQLPALRNQIRNSDGDQRSGSPMSDGDPGASSPGSTASPTRPRYS